MGSFNYDSACTCTVYAYTKVSECMRKSHLLGVYVVPDRQQSESNQAELPAEDHTHTPYVWLLFCHREYWKWIVIGTISILVLMNYKKQICNPWGSQESNVLLAGFLSLLMRFFYFKGRSTYRNFEKWRLEMRCFSGIYSSGMPLRDVYEEAGLWKFRKRRM